MAGGDTKLRSHFNAAIANRLKIAIEHTYLTRSRPYRLTID
ncbi:MAG: hypothetical protein ACMG55_02690 [Microcoleus sp.]